jgi:hypothetical protein
MLGPEWKVISTTTYAAETGAPIGWLADSTIDGKRYNLYLDRDTGRLTGKPVNSGSFLGSILGALAIGALILFIQMTPSSNDKVCDTDGCYSKSSIQQTIDANDGQGGY